MAIDLYTRDGHGSLRFRASAWYASTLTADDRGIANLVKSCLSPSILPRRDLCARRLASIADTCLTEILLSQVCTQAKDVLSDFRNTACFFRTYRTHVYRCQKHLCPNTENYPVTLAAAYCSCNIWRGEGCIEYEVFSFWKREINVVGLREDVVC